MSVCAECGNTGLRKVEKGPAGATYTVLGRCACQTPTIIIPRAQYEALMKAAFWLLKLRSLGYVSAGHGRTITDEILAILRAAGIEMESK